MPIREISPERQEAIRQQEILEHRRATEERSARYAQENVQKEREGEYKLRLAEIEEKYRTKHLFIIGITRALAWPFAIIAVYLLQRNDKDVPSSLESFLNT